MHPHIPGYPIVWGFVPIYWGIPVYGEAPRYTGLPQYMGMHPHTPWCPSRRGMHHGIHGGDPAWVGSGLKFDSPSALSVSVCGDIVSSSSCLAVPLQGDSGHCRFAYRWTDQCAGGADEVWHPEGSSQGITEIHNGSPPSTGIINTYTF